MPFEDSRRLTGSNLFFDSPGAVLETLGVTVDDAVLAGWRSRVARARTWLQWPEHAVSASQRAPASRRTRQVHRDPAACGRHFVGARGAR